MIMSRAAVIGLIVFCGISNIEADSVKWNELEVTVDGIDFKRGGTVNLYIFSSAGFPTKHEEALKNYQFTVEATSHTVVISVPNTSFALKVHHDEDDSGTITKNWTGLIPAEGLAFSSGAKLMFGPPSYKQAAMIYPDNDQTKLEIIYP